VARLDGGGTVPLLSAVVPGGRGAPRAAGTAQLRSLPQQPGNGLSYGEAATELDIPVGTLMSRLCRGRLELARRMSAPA
jgi:hypothetical protein